MDVGTIINVVLGVLNIALLVYSIGEKRKQNDYQRKLALYDKRLVVKNAILSFVAEVHTSSSNLVLEKSLQLLRDTRECKHLFNNEIKEYIDNMYKMALDLERLNAALEKEPIGDKRDKIVDNKTAIKTWFTDQFDYAAKLFSKYLDLTKD